MGWEGIHLYQFGLRAARYGSWELSASSPEVTVAALRLRKGARFTYEYDLNIPWRHEIRIESWLAPGMGKGHLVCIGGGGACPPENCDGPAAFMAGRNAMLSLDALEDLDTMTRSSARSSWSAGWNCSTTRIRAGGWSGLSSAARHASGHEAKRSRAERSTPGSAKASTWTLCISNADALNPASGE